MKIHPLPKGLWLFIGQLCTAVGIFFLFSLYVLAVQLKYDSLPVGYEKEFFYAITLLFAGFTYDCAKKIVTMERAKFPRFFTHAATALLWLGVFFALLFLCAMLFTISQVILGSIAYIALLGVIFFVIHQVVRAGEAVLPSARDDG